MFCLFMKRSTISHHVPWDHTGVHLECTDLGKYEEVVHYMGLEWALTL